MGICPLDSLRMNRNLPGSSDTGQCLREVGPGEMGGCGETRPRGGEEVPPLWVDACETLVQFPAFLLFLCPSPWDSIATRPFQVPAS